MSWNHAIQTEISHQPHLTDTGKHAGFFLKDQAHSIDILPNVRPGIEDV